MGTLSKIPVARFESDDDLEDDTTTQQGVRSRVGASSEGNVAVRPITPVMDARLRSPVRTPRAPSIFPAMPVTVPPPARPPSLAAEPASAPRTHAHPPSSSRLSPLPVLADETSEIHLSDHLSVFAEDDDIPDTLVDQDAPSMRARLGLERLPIVVDQNRLAEMVRGRPANESARLPSLTALAANERLRKTRRYTLAWVALTASIAFAAFAAGVAFHDARVVHALASILQLSHR